jgi:hypothetical protein
MASGTYKLATGVDDDDAGFGYEDESMAGTGWLSFAAIMLGFAGMFNVIDGILAVGNSKVYAANAVYVFSDLRTWGWIVLILGTLEIVAAFALFTGSKLAKWFGIVAAGLNAIGQLMFLPAYPFWSLALFAMDILIIYALAVYGGAKAVES